MLSAFRSEPPTRASRRNVHHGRLPNLRHPPRMPRTQARRNPPAFLLLAPSFRPPYVPTAEPSPTAVLGTKERGLQKLKDYYLKRVDFERVEAGEP